MRNGHASRSTASMKELIAFRGHPRGKVAMPSDVVEALHPIIAEKHIRMPTYGLPDEPMSPRQMLTITASMAKLPVSEL